MHSCLVLWGWYIYCKAICVSGASRSLEESCPKDTRRKKCIVLTSNPLQAHLCSEMLVSLLGVLLLLMICLPHMRQNADGMTVQTSVGGHLVVLGTQGWDMPD